ncbi:cytochrome P450 [Xylaria venustula]|nr:cytochrome P450 [Xylaria venustula]
MLIPMDLGPLATALSFLLLIRAIWTSIYNIFFRPLAKYPGPRLASLSDIWVAYHYSSGKWPWVVERTIKEYGDIVRIGPNSLAFLQPQAAIERDPEKHRVASKVMSLAFSGNALRAKIPTLNKYNDMMISRMRDNGQGEAGLNVSEWFTWLAMDSVTDLACGWELHELRDMKSHVFLEGMEEAGMLAIVLSTAKIDPRTMTLVSKMINSLRAKVIERIERRDNIMHPDFCEQLLSVRKYLIIGGYDTTSVVTYVFFFFGLRNPEVLVELKQEIRQTFHRYEDSNAEDLRSLPWLNACMKETLRVVTVATHHSLLRISSGAMVDGIIYVPKGVRVGAFFHDPSSFRPECRLAREHPKYDPAFADDDHRGFMPFITGARQCPGMGDSNFERQNLQS